MPEPHAEQLVYTESEDGYLLEGALFTPDSGGRTELPVEEQIVVETHLSECYLCASEAKSLRMVRDALRASAEAPVEAPVFVTRQQPRQHGLATARAGADGEPTAMSLDAQLASMSSAVRARGVAAMFLSMRRSSGR